MCLLFPALSRLLSPLRWSFCSPTDATLSLQLTPTLFHPASLPASPPQALDPIPQLRKYMLDSGLATEADLKELEAKVAEVVEDSVRFADESPKPEKGQLLENVFADPRGFGIAPDGRYRWGGGAECGGWGARGRGHRHG